MKLPRKIGLIENGFGQVALWNKNEHSAFDAVARYVREDVANKMLIALYAAHAHLYETGQRIEKSDQPITGVYYAIEEMEGLGNAE